VLDLIDDALKSATEAQTKTSNETDAKFQKAIKTLSDYERNSHRKNPVSNSGRVKTVEERMEAATVNDKSSSTILNRLKEEAVHVRGAYTFASSQSNTDSQLKPEKTKTVEFHLHKSLPDKSPTIVKRECRHVKFAHGI